MAAEYGVARLMLAAVGLGFAHPAEGRWLQLACAPGEGFERLAAAWGWKGWG